ncbi:MAG: F0F1 ATP synthase subunit alpha [Candidatus Sungbacteria bacterium]|nr:F0F1 ATP synthase subunit alpha [bacterium]MDZ4260515.1 F0F1 ATP synthase subunit alpha [Candidatus Sungbacteria bacterium]
MPKVDFNSYLAATGEVGFVDRVISSLVYVQGLPGVKPDELVVFESGEVGRTTALAEDAVELLNLSRSQIKVGSRVARTGSFLQIPVGDVLLGSVIDPLGHSLNPAKPLPPMKDIRMIDVMPQGIYARSRIKRACDTGISLIDLMIPLGKGQRELVIGDQKTGKTRVLMRTILTQVREGAIGIYVAIGKGQLAIKQVEEQFAHMGIAQQTVIVASSANDGAGMIFLTPYTAMTIAEYFRDQGRDVIIVLDDLSVHAKVYREISLLGRRFPGRNSYPGDIFYLHSKLLERAGNFIHKEKGETSITCLPVVEAPQGDMTGYIQTNIMSMTDGHLFFDHRLFSEGRRPAIDPFISVTRVGRQTQSHLKQQIARELTSFLRNVERIHTFKSFGAEMSEQIKRALEKEDRIVQFFDQTAYDTIASNVQIVLFALTWSDMWREKSKSDIRFLIQKIIFISETKSEIRKRIDDFVAGSDSLEALLTRIKEFDVLGEGK